MTNDDSSYNDMHTETSTTGRGTNSKEYLDTIALLQTNDAMTWAKAFISCNFSLKQIDEGLMVGWVANAMAAQEMIYGNSQRKEVLGALARGYCTDRNSHKILDPDLIEDMAREVTNG